MVLLPAYGRDYKSKKAVEADWYGGKDFAIASPLHESGRYVTNDELVTEGVVRTVNIRFDSNRKIAVLPVR